MLDDLGDILERFVVRVDEELSGPEMITEAFDGPDDASGFEFEWSPGPFVVEGGAADQDDGTDGAVEMFLVEGGPKTIDTGFAVGEKWAGVVADGVPVQVKEDRRDSKFTEYLADDGFH